MRIYRNPDKATVVRLLKESSLPVSDLDGLNLEPFFVADLDSAPAGVVGLEVFGSDAILRSLAVTGKLQGRGVGRQLVAVAESHAREMGVDTVYLLTTTAPAYFESLGYSQISRQHVPDAIAQTCQFSEICPDSAVCFKKSLPHRKLKRGQSPLI